LSKPSVATSERTNWLDEPADSRATHEPSQPSSVCPFAPSREFLDLIIENVPATIWVKDARDGRYVLINRAAEEMWGLARQDVIGKTATEIYAPAEAEIIRQRDQQLLRSGHHIVFDEHLLQTPSNGVRTVTSRRIAIQQNGENQYLLGVVEDVSERKMMEQKLQQAQKMEAVGNLTGGLAHDFNNLLLVIIGNLDLLSLDVAGNAAAEEKIETILEASLRGAELTKQMLAFSRRQPLQPKRVDVNALVDDTMRLLMRTLGETITYNVRLEKDLWPVFVDQGQLESALVNIAINARDAMAGGGRLTIATSNEHIDADFAARHVEFAAGDYVMITITDTGTGMPPDVVARIFEPFFTTKAPGKGTGLGLSMVYGFMKQSRGHISAYSEVGLGTTFKLYLPCDAAARAQAKQQDAVQAPAVAPARPGEVILVVDDNKDVRTAVCAQLSNLGYDVHDADTAAAALERLATLRVDLVFTDMVMPGGLSGKDLADRARAKFPGIKVLFTSGFPGKTFADGTELQPGDRLLSKPYRKNDLAQAIRDLLD
jgi:PAS domain S-box-containing protein